LSHNVVAAVVVAHAVYGRLDSELRPPADEQLL
jgi:hypothetical protein